jgi:hypothetical protein
MEGTSEGNSALRANVCLLHEAAWVPFGRFARRGALDRRYILENLRSRFDSEEKRNGRPHQREQPEHHKDRIDASVQ